jgi:hypothetical protein
MHSIAPRKPACGRVFKSFALLLAASHLAVAKTEFPPARVAEIAKMLPPGPIGLGRPITDRAAWERIAGQSSAKNTLATAAKLATTPLPDSPDDLYLDFSRTGNRVNWQQVATQRRSRITTFTLAECLENQGRYLQPLAQTIAALCAEKTWVMPAHDRSLGNFKGTLREMDLGACMLAWDLATADWLLGDRLPTATRQLLRENLDRRIFDPFQAMVEGREKPVYWLAATHNWNAVCLAGITGAALATMDAPERRAVFVAAGEHYIRYFLKGFTPDGYCSEGLGYWNYGFGHFLMLGESARQATGGKIDLLADPAALNPALFARRAEIINQLYPSIADCSPSAKPSPAIANYLAARLDNSAPTAAPWPSKINLYDVVLNEFLPESLPRIPHPTPDGESPLRTWFKDGGVLICRPAAGAAVPFAASLKGGNNAEHHNHNDVGSFILVLGDRMPVCDPGSEVYTSRTFSGQRYDSDVLNSSGHAVPVIAGQLQKTGASAQGKVLKTLFTDAEDQLALDLRSAYPVPSLEKLERTFTFRRGANPSLTVSDEIAFTQPESFETALITWGKWKQTAEDEIQITDGPSVVRVKIDTGGLPFQITSHQLTADVTTPRHPERIALKLKSPLRQGTVTLTITPLPAAL